MNHAYRLVWNSALGAWVVASELASACGKPTRGPRHRATAALLGAALLSVGLAAQAQQFSHWDGDGSGNAGNGVVDGGDGSWSATSTNWTQADGSSNGLRSPLPGVPVFQGSGGTVTIDNGQGAIDVAGMSFNAGGYRLQGGSIGLADPQSVFSVGAGLNATIAATLTGAGGLIKRDAGTLTLTGNNSYTGGTTIQQGAVAIGGAVGPNQESSVFGTGLVRMAGGTSLHYDVSGGGYVHYRLSNALALDGDLRVVGDGANGGTVSFVGPVSLGGGRHAIDAGTGRFFLEGVVSGSGDLDILAGIVGFTGQTAADNTFTGTVTVHGGAVGQFGRAGSIMVPGDLLVRSGGEAAIDTLYSIAPGYYAAPPSRTFGANSTVTIEAGGKLTIGAGAPVVPNLRGAGRVVLYDRRPIAGSGFFVESGDFSGVIEGRGSVEKRGPGTLILRGANTFSNSSGFDAFRVSGGSLIVEGSNASGVYATGASSLVGGGGIIGELQIHDGASAAPGAAPGSIDSLIVVRNLYLGPDSTYVVDIDGIGRSDRMLVGLQATIGGTVQVVKAPDQRYRAGTRYTIVSANQGITGQFAALTQNTPFIDLALAYDANKVYLDVLRSSVAFPAVGVTANQIAAATAAEALGEGNAVYDAVLGLNEAQARDAFERLSGDLHASAQTALLDDSRFIRDAIGSRLRDDGGRGAWAQAYGSWGSYDSDGNARELDRSIGGLLFGADTEVGERWRVGATGGYGRSTVSSQGRASVESDSLHLGVYAGVNAGGFALRFGAAYARHDLDSDRHVIFPDYSDRLQAGYDASTAQVFAGIGYRFERGRASYEPFLDLAYVSVRNDAYAERGGAAALSVRGGDTEAGFATLGLRTGTELGPAHAPIRATASLGWRHAYGDEAARTWMGFDGGQAFAIQGVPLARDAAVVEAGIEGALTSNSSIGLSYRGLIGDGLDDHGLQGRLTWRF